MNSEIQQKLEELSFLIKRDMPKETTSVTVFFNFHEMRVSFSQKTPEQLKKQGISMRNVAGEWIR